MGLRQVKVYKGGTREVGSGYVLPEYQHRGISAQLMNEILARETGPLYLMCNKKWKAYYEGFGFQDVKPKELPSDFYKDYLIGKVIHVGDRCYRLSGHKHYSDEEAGVGHARRSRFKRDVLHDNNHELPPLLRPWLRGVYYSSRAVSRACV